ncbi:hypothetical protein DIPPA_02141 [Diplonema papillatum]|nr:hypothetical protein DIPPA_02141 [Diplonema papillatum]
MAASSMDEARWGVDAVLLMHSWASAVQAGFAEREVENRHHAGKTEKQVRKAKLNDTTTATPPFLKEKRTHVNDQFLSEFVIDVGLIGSSASQS